MDSQTEALTDEALLALWRLHSRLVERDYTTTAGDVFEMMTRLEQDIRRMAA